MERQLGLFSFLILKHLELPCWIETHSLNCVFLCMCVHLCACVYTLVCMSRGWRQLEVCFFQFSLCLLRIKLRSSILVASDLNR